MHVEKATAAARVWRRDASRERTVQQTARAHEGDADASSTNELQSGCLRVLHRVSDRTSPKLAPVAGVDWR